MIWSGVHCDQPDIDKVQPQPPPADNMRAEYNQSLEQLHKMTIDMNAPQKQLPLAHFLPLERLKVLMEIVGFSPMFYSL